MESVTQEIKTKFNQYLQIYFCSCVDGRYRHLCTSTWKPDPRNWSHSNILIQCISRLYWAYTGNQSCWCGVSVRPKVQGAIYYILSSREDLDKREYDWLMEKNTQLKSLYPPALKKLPKTKKA